MNWQPIDTAPVSTPLEQKFFLAYLPDDPWGCGGNVHFACRYAYLEKGKCKPERANSARTFTAWMPIPTYDEAPQP